MHKFTFRFSLISIIAVFMASKVEKKGT